MTTYAVLRDGLPTAVTAAPYVSGQAIVVDGMTMAVSGTPANGDSFDIVPSTPSLSVFDMLDGAIVGLQTTGRTGSQIAQATSREPARHRFGDGQPCRRRAPPRARC